MKYTSVGSVLLTIDCEQKGENSILKFEVRDTGIGIKQEDITRLLVAFERMDSIRNRNIEGTGLGLNIVDRLLKLMNSRLYIDSEYGEGSVFMFSIEQRVISEQTIGNFEEQLKTHKEHQEYSPSFCAPNAKILLVEDNPLNRRDRKSVV